MKMKTALSLIAAAVAMLAQGAFAQSASAPTRAEVKAETKKAVKEGKTTPAGEAAPAAAAGGKSDKPRAEVKAETKKAVKEGATAPAGEAIKK